jgi:hypothetical protein
MPAGDVRDHSTVASLVTFEDSVCLPVELVTNGELAEAVREQMTVKSFDLPDLIADIYGWCCFIHRPGL